MPQKAHDSPSRNDSDSDFLSLSLQYLEGELEAADVRRLDRMMKSDQQKQASFVTLCMQSQLLREPLRHRLNDSQLAESELFECSFQPPVPTSSVVDDSRAEALAGFPYVWCALAAVVLLAVSLTWRMQPQPITEFDRIRTSDVVAVVSNAVGQVTINGKPVHSGSKVYAGVTLRTVSSTSSADLIYPDGTTFFMAGPATLQVNGSSGQKKLFLSNGNLCATIHKQPFGKPTLISTPDSELEMNDTNFGMSTLPETTEVMVTSGLATLRRTRDGEMIEVRSGQFARSESSGGKLQIESRQGVPVQWQAHLNAKRMEDWPIGMLVQSEISGAAMMTATDDASEFYSLATPKCWTSGIVQITETSVLNLRIRIAKPGFYQIMIGVRGFDFKPTALTGNYEYQERNFDQVPANQWRNLSIPLSQFKKAGSDGNQFFKDRPAVSPAAGDVVYFVYISSQTVDRGIMIDEMSITQEPPAAQTNRRRARKARDQSDRVRRDRRQKAGTNCRRARRALKLPQLVSQ
ncbi:FecR domain-containing protein [Stieleria sp. TO1_6]|uniref:FecR domain-containing protein n=1 Tax=Stieleria tagensis TaxID=2956795 RepID=UPI00209AE2DF|nr:FecR domain-containing protein [Stieleria tagensis]MCO8122942.1 FecR domain-containing protein [Stieleria tagensis]